MNKKFWSSIIIIGLSGQIAWTIENMYFNVFLYNTISTDPGYIALMVALSSIVATLTTILMGTVSDRIGKRKVFMTLGYIIWAITVFLFAFVKKENFQNVKNAAITIVILDCVMTFFGSTANDAVYNAYITENVEEEKRTKVETVVQILPTASTLIVFGLLDSFTQRGEWRTFFIITASIIAVAGILGIFLIKDKNTRKKENVSFIYSLTYGFRPKTIKENKRLYISLLAFGISSLGMQVFYPYLIIYIQNYLKFDNYTIILAIVLVVASIITVLLGKVIDKNGRVKCSFPLIVIMVVGMVLMFFARSFIFTTISGIIMMSGYLLTTSTLSSLIRKYTPEGKEGGIQGVRMIFQVMLPMILGPFLGSWAIKSSNITYVEFGEVKNVPTPLIFLIAAFICIFTVIPLLFLRKDEKNDSVSRVS